MARKIFKLILDKILVLKLCRKSPAERKGGSFGGRRLWLKGATTASTTASSTTSTTPTSTPKDYTSAGGSQAGLQHRE
jgi:hypothetical protein